MLLWPESAVDPPAEPDHLPEQAAAFHDLGATILNYRLVSRSPAQHVEQIEALAELVDLTRPDLTRRSCRLSSSVC